MPRLSTGSLLAALFIGALVTGSPAAAATVVAQRDDATIAHDASAGNWTLSAAGASLTLALDPSRDFAIVSLLSASGATWNTSAAADTFVRVGSRTLAFGSRPAGFAYRDVGRRHQRQHAAARRHVQSGGGRSDLHAPLRDRAGLAVVRSVDDV